MKLNKFLKAIEEEILEESLLVTKLVTSFRSLKDRLPSGWGDVTGSIEPFGRNWGRGIIENDGKAYSTTFSTKHAQMKGEGGTKSSFYWGYIIEEKALYLNEASIRGDGINKKNIAEIVNSIINIKKMNFNWKVAPNQVIWS